MNTLGGICELDCNFRLRSAGCVKACQTDSDATTTCTDESGEEAWTRESRVESKMTVIETRRLMWQEGRWGRRLLALPSRGRQLVLFRSRTVQSSREFQHVSVWRHPHSCEQEQRECTLQPARPVSDDDGQLICNIARTKKASPTIGQHTIQMTCSASAHHQSGTIRRIPTTLEQLRLTRHCESVSPGCSRGRSG